jgi:hypothetical protein
MEDLMNINNVRTPLYEASRIHGMIEPLKELRKNVKASRGEIKGSFNLDFGTFSHYELNLTF